MDITNSKTYTPVLLTSTALAHSNKEVEQNSTVIGVRKDIDLQVISSNIAALSVEKPVLKMGNTTIDTEQLLSALGQLGSEEKAALLGDIRQFLAITPEQMQQAVLTVMTEEKSAIEQVFQDAQQPDETEIKQLSQAIQVMLASSFFKETFSKQLDSGTESSKVIAAEAKSSQFVGIASSDVLMELMKIIRKVVAELNISDRRISSNFLMLSGKMTEAAAESTIKEGKEMFKGALIGFATSMAISGAGAAFQLKSLRTQSLSIKDNLVKANQNSASAERLASLTSNHNITKSAAPLSLKTKGGSTVDMVDSPNMAQQNLANQRTTEAAQRTNKLGQAEYQKHDQVMNRERTKSGIAEQGSRLSDNAGQMATSANQINVKEEEASKMRQQSVADIARTVSSDKDKQIDKDKDLVKQMHEHLRDIRESQLRTMQSMVRG
ncbi:IpaC/SipC family type III secretion system effector [Providencia rettgeri]|uniref:IpaC/SipC family type III secretion system effector n=1 Tax=Providencia rettgeri TaxID=587 RepID=UPI0023AB1D50|nr:IpaC/SipC family type III secretion system effector [Providencia rettgeri]